MEISVEDFVTFVVLIPAIAIFTGLGLFMFCPLGD